MIRHYKFYFILVFFTHILCFNAEVNSKLDDKVHLFNHSF